MAVAAAAAAWPALGRTGQYDEAANVLGVIVVSGKAGHQVAGDQPGLYYRCRTWHGRVVPLESSFDCSAAAEEP